MTEKIRAENVDRREVEVASVSDIQLHVDSDIMDHLMNLTGELVLPYNHVAQFAGNDVVDPQIFRNVAQRLNVVVSELQETMMKTRMQPVKKIFALLPYAIEETSSSHAQSVELHLKGQETELDLRLLEQLKKPLSSLVRNAIEYGIETPDVRERWTKSPTDTVAIRAYHDSGQVNIEINDAGE